MYAVLMKQMLYLKMLAWLEDNIYCNPAIDDLALYMGYSRRFVYDVFYQYGQLPIGQYIRLRRLTIAAVSLRLTRQPIAAIAWQLSYDSPQTFSREFKKRFSLSPRESPTPLTAPSPKRILPSWFTVNFRLLSFTSGPSV